MNDAGRIGFLIKGTYDATATYEFLDVVTYQGSSYVAKRTTTGNVPVASSDDWQLLAGGASISGIDSALSTTSTNPVENRAIATAINVIAEDVGDAQSAIGQLNADLSAQSDDLAQVQADVAAQADRLDGIDTSITNINTALAGKSNLIAIVTSSASTGAMTAGQTKEVTVSFPTKAGYTRTPLYNAWCNSANHRILGTRRSASSVSVIVECAVAGTGTLYTDFLLIKN